MARPASMCGLYAADPLAAQFVLGLWPALKWRSEKMKETASTTKIIRLTKDDIIRMLYKAGKKPSPEASIYLVAIGSESNRKGAYINDATELYVEWEEAT